MTASSPEHLVPGAAPVSSQRLQASAQHYGPVLNHPVEHRGSAQSATFSGLPLSAIPTKPSPGKLAAAPNPHRRPSPHPLSRRFVLRWLSYAGLLTGPPLAPGRHPKPFPIAVPPANPRVLALKGDLDAARSAVAASLELRPEVNSLASWRAENLFYTIIWTASGGECFG